MVSIISKNEKVFAVINDGLDDYKSLVPVSIPPNEIFERIDKNDKGIYLKKIEKNEKFEFIKNSRLKISDEDCDLKYLFNPKTETLLIKATKYLNSRIYTLERKNLSFNSNQLLIRYINEEIQPFLQFRNQKLVITKDLQILQREFLAEGTRIFKNKEFSITVNKIVNDEGIFLEFVAKADVVTDAITQNFLVVQVLESLEIFEIKEIENNPHFAILPLQMHDQVLVIRKLEKKHVQCIYTSKNVFNGCEYELKVFKIHDDKISYFFEAFGTKLLNLSSFSITDKDLSEFYSIPAKKIKNFISSIVNSIQLKEGKLSLTFEVLEKQKKEDSETKNFYEQNLFFVVKIQAFFRACLVRDKLKLIRPKKNLLHSCIKNFDQFTAKINFYQVGDPILLEILCKSLEKSFYLFVLQPKNCFHKYTRLFDVKTIIKSIKQARNTFSIPTLKENIILEPSFFCSEEEYDEPDWPILIPKLSQGHEYLILGREMPGKSLLAKIIPLKTQQCIHKIFSLSEITEVIGGYRPLSIMNLLRLHSNTILISDVINTPTVLNPSNNENVIFRTCKKLSGKLYQVTCSVSTSQSSEEFLTFLFRKGSVTDLTKAFSINLQNACEKTGFVNEKNFLVPMANYIIKNLLYMKNDEIFFDDSKPPFDINTAAIKIQALVRKFLIRKKINEKLRFSLLSKRKGKIENELFTVMLFKNNNDYLISAVHQTQVFSVYLDRKLVENIQNPEKFLEKIIKKLKFKQKNGKTKLTGLKKYKIARNLKVSTPESLNSNSVISRMSPISFQPKLKESEANNKILK